MAGMQQSDQEMDDLITVAQEWSVPTQGTHTAALTATTINVFTTTCHRVKKSKQCWLPMNHDLVIVIAAGRLVNLYIFLMVSVFQRLSGDFPPCAGCLDGSCMLT